jgi:hypothetical protein
MECLRNAQLKRIVNQVLAVLTISLSVQYGAAGVITYTFGAPNNNAGTMAIGYPLTPMNIMGVAGVVANFPVNGANQIITFNVGQSVAAGGAETLATKQANIVAYIKANLPNTLMVGTPAANQVSITIPAADLANLKKAGQTPGIGVMATNGVETEGFLKAKDDPTIGLIDFNGLFSAEDADGVTAQFTAGFTSDLGSPAPLVLGPGAFSSLNGETIAQTFYTDLLPVATSLGIQLAFTSNGTNDGEIIAYFPNGTAASNGGVVFGSTSDTGTVIAALNAEAPEPAELALVMAGLACIVAVRRMRHRASANAATGPPANLSDAGVKVPPGLELFKKEGENGWSYRWAGREDSVR